MSYSHSQIDRTNSNWFHNDCTSISLKKIDITEGSLRGVNDLSVDLRYPITAIAGRNGSGKTTLLALAACAFHNSPDGFNPLGRKYAYYTFSDFFIQSSEEIPLEGIEITYAIHYNNWRKSPGFPEGKGIGLQFRKKKRGGRWNDYRGRVYRDVVFLGIDRIVPHSERTVYKSYKSRFENLKCEGWEQTVCETVGRILSRQYGSLKYKSHRKYRLPIVSDTSGTYTGFNMGAGENALFKLFSTIYRCPNPLLLIVDELELGLHSEAQRVMVNELKKICKTRKLQVICTTHSASILESLPPEARLFLERAGNTVNVTSDISVEYALGRLSGVGLPELDILVEDEVAADIVRSALAVKTRSRVRLIPIGSHSACMRHMAMRRKESVNNCLVFLDGDCRGDLKSLESVFISTLETDNTQESKDWLNARLNFVPGDHWPERCLVESMRSSVFSGLDQEWGISENDRLQLAQRASQAEKHSEFYCLSQLVGLSEEVVRNRVIYWSLEASPAVKQHFRDLVDKALNWPR